MTDNYLTVKEYASQANVSVQRVYQRLNEDLKQYVKNLFHTHNIFKLFVSCLFYISKARQ